MREISVYFKNFDLHRDAYLKIQNELADLYQNYINNDKIIVLFEYWLFSLSTLHRCYGDKGLSEFLLSRNNDPIAYSYLNEFSMKGGSPSVFKTGNGLISWVDRYFSVGYRFPSAPSAGFFSKLRVRYSKLLISQMSCVVDGNLDLKLVELINRYLKCLNINMNPEKVSQNIPVVFKSHQVKCYNLKGSKLSCSPIEIIEFRGYECIFLLNRKINLVGHAHGGGYDVTSNDPLTYFEKKISDSFFGWGFSEENSYQTRYLTVQKSFKETTIGKIVWIESSRDSKYWFYCYPVLSAVKADEDIPFYIHKELLKIGVKYYNKTYPGKLESNRYKNLRGTVVSSNQPAEEIVRKNDVVIFDNCAHSLMYHCLENNILFLIVEKRLAVKQYTPKMFLWYKILRRNNLLFHDDECGLFGKRIKALDSPRVLPKEVYVYYKNIFNLTS